MNRVIKFRAWDDRNKVMFHFFRMCKPKGSGTLSFECKDNLHEEWDNVDWDNVHIMQFTGLLDKNGKDIYEGDIMKFLDENWLVIYFEQYASFMLQKGNDLANITTQEEKIGNVYERPDLLK